jgi:hypothetical protein
LPSEREIEAAIAAFNRNDRERLLLPPDAGRLLAIMFARDTVCRRSLGSLKADGFERRPVIQLLKILTAAGFLTKEPGRPGVLSIYHLHLPPRRQR